MDPILLVLAGVTAFILFRLISTLAPQRSVELEVKKDSNGSDPPHSGASKVQSAVRQILRAVFYLIGLFGAFLVVAARFNAVYDDAFLIKPSSLLELFLFVADQTARGGLADFIETFGVSISRAEHNPKSLFAIVIFAYRLVVGTAVFGAVFRALLSLYQFFIHFWMARRRTYLEHYLHTIVQKWYFRPLLVAAILALLAQLGLLILSSEFKLSFDFN
ncbi:MAG: hypothetical protein AAFX54_12745 [Pseudomonadota bacterium]